MPITKIPLFDRLWEKIDKTDMTGCWLFTGSINERGYGYILSDKRRELVRVHRAAYKLAYGHIIEELDVLHKCDVRNCCRPSHLFQGTGFDNQNDMRLKGRGYHPGPTKRKLTREQVIEIRKKYIPRTYGTTKLAEEYGVNNKTIWNIVNYRKWTSVE